MSLSFNVRRTTSIAEIIVTIGHCTRNILKAIEFKLYKYKLIALILSLSLLKNV
jgi:hypothetical protein